MRIITIIEDTNGERDVHAEHGLSLYVETSSHTLLVDTGASDLTWENAAKLGIDLQRVDTVVISHGHYDHAGGLLGFTAQNPNAKIYLHREALGDFYHRDRYIGIDKRIGGLAQLCLTDGTWEIDDELTLFADITGRRLWPRANLSLCERCGDGEKQDSFRHEQCLVIREAGKTVLLSGCAHNGILNILDRYHTRFGGYPDVVISGFHMAKKADYTPEEAEEIRETARQLLTLPTRFYTGHCTGQRAFDLMRELMGERLARLHAGDEVCL